MFTRRKYRSQDKTFPEIVQILTVTAESLSVVSFDQHHLSVRGYGNNSSRYQPPRFCLSDIPTCRYPDVHTHKDIVNPQLV